MPNTTLPKAKEKAAEISRKITNSRPQQRDKDSPEGQVTGGFNQKRQEMAEKPLPPAKDATDGDSE